MRYAFTLFFCLCLISLQAQHAVDFTVQTQVCLGEYLKLQNTSNPGGISKWDYCSDQLGRDYSSVTVNSVATNMTDIELVEDNGQWFGFATSRSSGLLRLDFGNSPYNTYSITTLGNFGNLLGSPEGISIIKEGNNWYGLVTLISNEIIRLSWGTSLASMPMAQSLNLNSTGKLDVPIQIEIQYDAGNYTAIVANGNSNFIAMVNFGTSLSNVVGVSDIITTPALPGALNLYGVSASNQCGQWMLFAIAQNKIYRINVGSVLYSTVTLGQIEDFTSSVPISIGSFNKIKAIDIGKNSYVYFTSFTARYVAAIKWEVGVASPQFLSLGTPAVPANSYGFDVFQFQGKFALYVSGFGGEMNRIATDGICHSNVALSTADNPVGVFYDQPGTYTINLEVTYSDGQVCSQTRQIVVTSDTAPAPVIDSDNICVNSSVTFSAVSQNQIAISNWNWDFGTGTSTAENPSYAFNMSGTYPINVDVTASNGCHNTATKLLKIYGKPIALFSAPSGLICTNNEFTFTNATTDNFDGNLSYQWLVDTSPISTNRDLKYTFTSGGNSDVKLLVTIPGCSDETSQTIAGIQTGPIAGFLYTGQCEDKVLSFTNSSSGSITGYEWDFANGNTSTDENPTQTFSDIGVYSVTLATTATNGCVSYISQDVTIYSNPQPDFSIELPPFSCSGTPSQFTNATANPSDSNIASWVWSFGDSNNGTSSVKNPLYTYTSAGNYNVSLTATSNFNCAATTTKIVTIQQGPPVNFTNTPACVDQGTRFTDQSGGNIKTWFWMIGNSTYAFSNPTHVFSSTGNYNAQLTVTGNNDCVASITKIIKVPIPPILSFSVSNACEGQATSFNSTSPVHSDPVKSVSWDFVGNEKLGTPATYSFETTGTYAVKMNSTQQSGCVYSISKNVVIAPTPQAKFTSNPEWGVPPLAVQFTNQSVGASTYLWHFNDKSNSTSTAVSPNFQFTDLGDYAVDLTATNAQNCSNTASAKISVIIPSLDLELKDLNLIKDPTSGLYRVMVTIKNRSNFAMNSADVVIDISGNARIKETITTSILPDGEISQLLVNQIIPGNQFTYLCAELDVVNDLDLFNNKKCEPVNDEGVMFLPYPNPSEGQFQFDWISLTEETASFTIFNSMGQVVLEHDIATTSSGLNQARFDLRSYSNGTYFFKFTTNSLSKTIPIAIVR